MRSSENQLMNRKIQTYNSRESGGKYTTRPARMTLTSTPRQQPSPAARPELDRGLVRRAPAAAVRPRQVIAAWSSMDTQSLCNALLHGVITLGSVSRFFEKFRELPSAPARPRPAARPRVRIVVSEIEVPNMLLILV
jgi:hypothetical protein